MRIGQPWSGLSRIAGWPWNNVRLRGGALVPGRSDGPGDSVWSRRAVLAWLAGKAVLTGTPRNARIAGLKTVTEMGLIYELSE